MLHKGRQVFVALSDLHNTSYTKRDGQASDPIMVATVIQIEFASAGVDRELAQSKSTPSASPAAALIDSQPFEDPGDDIPF
jgi:hypothetical protein